MKKFIKLIPVFLLFCLTSFTVKAQDSTSLCLEELNTDVYEEILTTYYEVETGYAYCSSAVNLTSSVEITEDVSVTILDAYGSNVWRVDTSLETADSNCTVVELNNNFYYLSAVSNAVFTEEGVTFSTNKLGTYIAGGCFSEEDIENFSAGTSNFNIENNAIWTDASGKAYYAADALAVYDVSKNQDGGIKCYNFDTDANGKYDLSVVTSTSPDNVLASCNIYMSENNMYLLFCSKYATKMVFRDSVKAGTFCNYFYNHKVLENIIGLDKLNTSNATDMSHMFTCSVSSSSDTMQFVTLDLSSFDTSNVTNMYSMFQYCRNLNTLNISNFNTGKVTNMRSMFSNCNSLTSLDISNLTTSSCLYMDYMFYGCRELTTLDLTNFDTSNVKNMEGMFGACYKLESLNFDILKFNTSNVTNMSRMFEDCFVLNALDVSNFNTSNVTDMNNMFSDCRKVNNLDVSNFNTINVTNMSTMFSSCKSLTTLDLSNFNTSNVTNINNTFRSLSNLVQLNISNFDLHSVTQYSSVFSDSNKLNKIILPKNIGTTSIELPKTYYGYAADDTFPDKTKTYTTLPAADSVTGLSYISTTKYPATEALLRNVSNADYFLGVEHNSFKRGNIASVTFQTENTSDTIEGSIYGPVDISLYNDDGVVTYSKASSISGLYDIYVITQFNKFYTNENTEGGTKNLFKCLYNCKNIIGLDKLDLSRSSTAEGMFSGYAPASVNLPSEYYAHSENVDDQGNSTSSTYSNKLAETTNISIPGASKLEITITLQTESTSYDWVAIYPGNVTPNATNYSEATVSNGKLGGTTKTTKTFTYEGDSINIFFRTDGSGNTYYGYYALVKGLDADGSVFTSTLELGKKELDLSDLSLPSTIDVTDFFAGCEHLSQLKTPSTNSISTIALPITMYTWPDKTSYTVMPTTSGTSVVLHDSDVVPFILNTAGDLYGTIDATTKVLTITGTGTALDKKLRDSIGYENCEAITGIVFETDTIESICDSWCMLCSVSFKRDGVDYNYALFKNLTGELVLPANLKTIGNNAFRSCKFTGSLLIPEGVTYIGNLAFFDCGFKGTLMLNSNLETIGNFSFSCCGFTGELTLPNSLSSIGSDAFSNSDFTGELVIPNSITTIQTSAFNSCSFTKLVIPDSVTTIEDKAFWKCNGITEITIGTGLTSIGKEAFACMTYMLGTGFVLVDNPVPTVLNTTNVNAIQYDWSGNRRDVSLRYNLSTSGDLYGDLNITTGLLTVKGTGTNLNRALYNVLKSDEERALLKGISFETQTVEIIGYSWCDNYNYNIDPETHEVILYFPNLTGNLVLPSNLKVIKNHAFWWCNQLTGDLVIPEGVTSIGSYAFCKCKNMTGSLTLPSTLTTIDTSGFASIGCTGSITLPNSLTNVGINAFSGCHGFTGDVVIPRSMTSIPNGMFDWCVNLNGTLTIPNTITSIGKDAFSCCTFTGTLTIPSSVTTIGEIGTDNSYSVGAFQGCTGFTKLVLNEGVTSIGDLTFSGCTGLSEVKIPDSVTTIGGHVFSDCTNLDTITIGNGITSTANIRNNIFRLPGGSNKDTFVKTENQVFLNYSWSGDNRNVKFCNIYDLNNAHDLYGCVEKSTGVLYVTGTGKNLDRLLRSCLRTDCEHLTGIVFETQTVEEICNQWCDNYKSSSEQYFPNLAGTLELPNNLKTIGSIAFYGCEFTGDLNLPESIESIGSRAFSHCTGFTGDLVIPNSVTFLDEEAFEYCSGFDGTLTIGTGLTELKNGTFAGCTGFTGDLIIPNNITVLGEVTTVSVKGVFAGCTGFNGTLTLSNDLVTIGASSFINCSGLTGSLTIPESVTQIGHAAFYNCSGFTGNLVIPNNVTDINMQAFWKCTGFNGTLTLGNSLQTIGYGCFSGCSNLTGDLVIPNSVTSIGVSAFENCKGMTGTLTLSNQLTNIPSNCFEYDKFTGDLTIPESVTSIDSYAFAWCFGFNGNLQLSSNLETIGSYAFYCDKFTGDLIIPDKVTVIEEFTFGSGNYTSLTLNQGLQMIKENAFYSTDTFRGDLVIPNSVTTIEKCAFQMCYFNGSLKLPNNITTITAQCFENCLFTGRLVIPDSVSVIENNAFYQCYFDTLVIPNSVTSLGNKAFYNCIYLNKLYIDGGIQTIGEECFYSTGRAKTYTKLYTTSEVVKNYDWSGDNRTILPMNTFTFALPQDISLKPKYLNVADAPVFYSAFNMEITGDFEDGSYGTFEGVPSFTISTDSGETRTVTTNVENTTVSEDGTITVPIIFTAPNPTLTEEFSGQFQLPTVLHEVLPFAS